MPMLLLFNVMGAKVHNQREVLLMPMVMERGYEVNNLREMLLLLQLSVMVPKVFNKMETPPLPLSM